MPARNSTIPVNGSGWTALSDGAVASCRIQKVGGGHVMVQATTANAAPASDGGALHLAWSWEGGVVDVPTRFPGIGATAYLWARSTSAGVSVSVSHG